MKGKVVLACWRHDELSRLLGCRADANMTAFRRTPKERGETANTTHARCRFIHTVRSAICICPFCWHKSSAHFPSRACPKQPKTMLSWRCHWPLCNLWSQRSSCDQDEQLNPPVINGGHEEGPGLEEPWHGHAAQTWSRKTMFDPLTIQRFHGWSNQLKEGESEEECLGGLIEGLCATHHLQSQLSTCSSRRELCNRAPWVQNTLPGNCSMVATCDKS